MSCMYFSSCTALISANDGNRFDFSFGPEEENGRVAIVEVATLKPKLTVGVIVRIMAQCVMRFI